jgi:hypothetical protein
MHRLIPALPGACLLLALFPSSAVAQVQSGADEPEERPRLTFGPLGVTPKLALRDIGVDTNVFRTATDARRDFTATIGPGADTWLRLGRTRLRTSTQLDWIYFQRFGEQRSFNFSEDVRVDVDLVRVAPFLRTSFARTRQRTNPELDLRIRQRRTLVGGGANIRVGPNLVVETEVLASQLSLDDETPEEAVLAAALNRRTHAGSVSGRWRLTPLTTFVLRGEVARDEFEHTPLRDSRSFMLLPGLELRPLALISGHAFVGVKRFATDDEMLPDFTGLIAEVAVGWTISDLARFSVQVRRDVEYSFQETDPYFLLTDVGVDARHALGYDWDVVGRAGLSNLAYRSVAAGLPIAGGDRIDWAHLVGGGVGRRFGDDIRVGVDVDRVSRRSSRIDREFQGFRIGGTFTYGYD